MKYYVYILTNWNNQVMYIGVTNDLNRRLYEHKNGLLERYYDAQSPSSLGKG
ncbi:MAG: GIY-YIG nuclease family protein [Eubacterium sp.]|nr:GIY-YIG nuclease family protein [Eubacterium sp.]